MNFRDSATRGKSPRSLLSPSPVRNTTPVPPGRPLPVQRLSMPPSIVQSPPKSTEKTPKTIKGSQKVEAAKVQLNRNATKTKPDVATPIKVDMASVLRNRQKNSKSPTSSGATAGTSSSNVPFSSTDKSVKADAEEKKMSIKSFPPTKTVEKPFFLVRRETTVAPSPVTPAPTPTNSVPAMSVPARIERAMSPLPSPDTSPNVSTIGTPKPICSLPESASMKNSGNKGKKIKPRPTDILELWDNFGRVASRSHEEVTKRSSLDLPELQTMNITTGSPSASPDKETMSHSIKVIKLFPEPPDDKPVNVSVGPTRQPAKNDGPKIFRNAEMDSSKELLETSSIMNAAHLHGRSTFSEISSTSSTDCVLSSTEQLKSSEERKLKLPGKWMMYDSSHHVKHRVRKPRSVDNDNQVIYLELKKKPSNRSRLDLDNEDCGPQLVGIAPDDEMEVAISFTNSKSASDTAHTTDFSDHFFLPGAENFSFQQLELNPESNQRAMVNEGLNPTLIDTVFKEQTYQLQQQLEEQRQLRLQLEKQQKIQMELHRQQQELQRQLFQMQQTSNANIRLESAKGHLPTTELPSVMETIKSMLASKSFTSHKSSSERLKLPDMEKSLIRTSEKKIERLLTAEVKTPSMTSGSSVNSGIASKTSNEDPKSGTTESFNLKSASPALKENGFKYVDRSSGRDASAVNSGHAKSADTDGSSAPSKEALQPNGERRIRKRTIERVPIRDNGQFRAVRNMESMESHSRSESVTTEEGLSEATSKSGEWQLEIDDKKLKNVKEMRVTLAKAAQGTAIRDRESAKTKFDILNKSNRTSRIVGTPGTSRNVATKSLSPVKTNRANDVERNKSISPMYRISVLDMVSKKVRAKAKDSAEERENVPVADETVRENLQSRIIITTEDGVTPTTRNVTLGLDNFLNESEEKPVVSSRQSRSRLKRVTPVVEKMRSHAHYADQTRSKMIPEQHAKKETVVPKTRERTSSEPQKPSALKGLFNKIDRVVADLESYMEIDPHTPFSEEPAIRPPEQSAGPATLKSKGKDRDRQVALRKFSPLSKARTVMHDDTEAPTTSVATPHQLYKLRKQENFDDKSMTDSDERKKKKHIVQVTARRKTKDDESIPYEDILRKSAEKWKRNPQKESVMSQTEASDIALVSKQIAKEFAKQQLGANEGDGQKSVKQLVRKTEQPPRKEIAAKLKKSEVPKAQSKRVVETPKVEDDSKVNKQPVKGLKEGIIGDGETQRHKKKHLSVPRPEIPVRSKVKEAGNERNADREAQRPGVSGEKDAKRHGASGASGASEMGEIFCMGDTKQSLKSLTSLSTETPSATSVQSNKMLENLSGSDKSTEQIANTGTESELSSTSSQFAFAVMNAPTPPTPPSPQSNMVRSVCNLSSSFKRFITSQRSQVVVPRVAEAQNSDEQTNQDTEFAVAVVTKKSNWLNQNVVVQSLDKITSSLRRLVSGDKKAEIVDQVTIETEEDQLRKLQLRDARKQKMFDFQKRLSEKFFQVEPNTDLVETSRAMSAETLLASEAVNPILQEILYPNISMEAEKLLTVLRSPQISITLVTSDSSSGDGIVDTSTELVKLNRSKSCDRKPLNERMSTMSVVKEKPENDLENNRNTNSQPSHFAIAFVMNDNNERSENEYKVKPSPTFVFQHEELETGSLAAKFSIDSNVAGRPIDGDLSEDSPDQPSFGAPHPQLYGAPAPQPSYGAPAPQISSTRPKRSSISQQTDDDFPVHAFEDVSSVQPEPFLTLTPTHFGVSEPTLYPPEMIGPSRQTYADVAQSPVDVKDSEQFVPVNRYPSSDTQLGNNPMPDSSVNSISASNSVTVLKFDQSLSAKAGSILSAVLGATGQDGTDERPSTSSGLRHEPNLTDEYTITVVVMEPIGAKAKRKRPTEQTIDRTLDKLLSSVKSMVNERKARNAGRLEPDEDSLNHAEDSLFSVAMILMDPGRSQVTPDSSCVTMAQNDESQVNAKAIDMSRITSWSQVKELNSTEFSEVIRDTEDSISDHKVSDLLDVDMMATELKEQKKKGDRSK